MKKIIITLLLLIPLMMHAQIKANQDSIMYEQKMELFKDAKL